MDASTLNIVLLLVSVLLGVGLLVVTSQLSRFKTKAEVSQNHLQELETSIHDAQQQNLKLTEQQHVFQSQISDYREQLARNEMQIQSLNERLSHQQTEFERLQSSARETQAELNQTNLLNTRLETQLREKQEQYQQQLKQLEENRQLLKKEFESLAQEILEKKGKAFAEASQQNISNLLLPMRTELKGFKERVEKMHQIDADQRVQLRTELQNLQQLNKEITDQAESLTRALQGQKKLQGNWGELILENVLDSSGLRADKDYKREVSLDSEEGRFRPDVVVYLPEGKHLIIDAKTSLAAYTRYVNAEDEAARLQALKEHSEAVAARIKELADKRYYKLNGLNSPEVVIMFIPIESAYVEALRYNETLFQQAIEQQVLVATPTTLLTSLNIVRQLWRFEDQSKHSAQLADRAEKFYTKLNAFLGSMQEVGKRIESARQSYDKALAQLYSGRGNLIKQASEFKELGVSVQKELPDELVEKAALELDLLDRATGIESTSSKPD